MLGTDSLEHTEGDSRMKNQFLVMKLACWYEREHVPKKPSVTNGTAQKSGNGSSTNKVLLLQDSLGLKDSKMHLLAQFNGMENLHQCHTRLFYLL